MYMLCCAVTNLTLKIRIHTKDGSDGNSPAENMEHEEDDRMVNKIDKLTLEMCENLYNSGVTVNMDNYYMSTICAMHLRNKGVYCRGTIRSSRKFVPKSILLTSTEARTMPRGTMRCVVNPAHNMVAVGWLDNKPVHFISTSDTTAVHSVQHRIGSTKVDVPAPEVVCNYNKYMGGVDRHDKLHSTFSVAQV